MMNKTFAVACLMAVAMSIKTTCTVDDNTPVLAQATSHSCHTAQDRNKADLDDFWSIYNGSSMWTDEVFGHDSSALYWSDMGESEGDMAKEEQWITWKRITDVYANDSNTHTLFGSTGITHEDIRQGAIGNCWFMSGASVLAEIPGRMEKVFLNPENTISANGIYAVNFYTLGLPHTVIVDDYLPLEAQGSGFKTLFAHVSEDKGLWGPILEKAFAKYHGNYEHIVGGDPNYSVRTLSGSPFYDVWHKDVSTEELWTLLQTHDAEDDILQAGTPGTSHFDAGVQGLANNHAYSVIGVKTLSTGDRLVMMRNPWGAEEFTGDWSDSSTKWTDELKEEAGWVSANDGSFFMSIEDYASQAEQTYVAKDVSDWHKASFLKLNDTTGGNNSNPQWYCGADCTEHKFTLTSSVDQEVWITGHTWDHRCMADSCEKWDEEIYNALWHTGAEFNQLFKYGDYAAKPIQMTAGQEIEIKTVWNFSAEEIASDFSVIAYAATGELTLTHSEGLTTDVLPVLGAQESDDTPTPAPTPEEDSDEDVTPTPTPEEDSDEDVTPTPTPEDESDEDVTPTPDDEEEDEDDEEDEDQDDEEEEDEDQDGEDDEEEPYEIIGDATEYLFECEEEGEGCTECRNAWMSDDPEFQYPVCTDYTVYRYGNACKEKHDRSRCSQGDDMYACQWSYDFSDSAKYKSDTKACRTVPDSLQTWYAEMYGIEIEWARKVKKNNKQGLCSYDDQCECRWSWSSEDEQRWKGASSMARCKYD